MPETGQWICHARPGLRRSRHRYRDTAVVPDSLPSSSLQLRAAGQAVLVQPGGSGDETVLVFLGGEPSHAFTKQADASQAEPDFESGTWVRPPWPALRRQLTGELLYAGPHRRSGSRDPRLLELQLVDPSLGWQWLDPDIRNLASVTSLCIGQRWSGWGWARSPIDAPGGAAAAPAVNGTTRAARYPGSIAWQTATRAARATARRVAPGSRVLAPGQQPETQPISSAGRQPTATMHMHQGGDFDFQPRLFDPAGADSRAGCDMLSTAAVSSASAMTYSCYG